jgi:hypothetical protein
MKKLILLSIFNHSTNISYTCNLRGEIVLTVMWRSGHGDKAWSVGEKVVASVMVGLGSQSQSHHAHCGCVKV